MVKNPIARPRGRKPMNCFSKTKKQIISNQIFKKYQKTQTRKSSIKASIKLSISNNAKPSLIKKGKKKTINKKIKTI
jgi:hypothetical protein